MLVTLKYEEIISSNVYSVQQTQFLAILKPSRQNKRVNMVSSKRMRRPIYIAFIVTKQHFSKV